MTKNYTATVEVAKRGNMPAAEVDATMDRLANNTVSLSVSPRGYRTVVITLPAADIAQAATSAALVAAYGFGVDVDRVIHVDVMSEAEADLREGSLEVPDLIGAAEAAQLLGVSPQRVRQMIDEGKISAHRVGERSFALARSEVHAKVAKANVVPEADQVAVDRWKGEGGHGYKPGHADGAQL